MSELTQDSTDQANDVAIRSVEELPEPYRKIFVSTFQHFNQVQSSLLDFILSTNKSLALCAPTGSGKTVLLELSIIKELIDIDNMSNSSNSINRYSCFHALYLAPLKAIVQEKYNDWQQKFASFGLKCFTLTGDTELEDLITLKISNYMEINILLATPEKFDHIIRTDPESRQFLRILQLVLIDEIHMIGDNQRGDILEATITRIKAIRDNSNNIVKIINSVGQSSLTPKEFVSLNKTNLKPIRFLGISATAPNVDDISAWLDIKNGLGIYVEPNLRPVKLNKIVIGYEPIASSCSSEYKFDIQLSYKLENIIRMHSSNKPTLIFCSTRKSVEFTAKILSSSKLTFFESHEQRTNLYFELSKLTTSNMSHSLLTIEPTFKNSELKETLKCGVGFYHSGLDFHDRRLLEQLFTMSLIPVLVSTSSLAMGVNLPAHLVIIKNTVQYNVGSTVEYDISQILQMIGRAGRPQFDTTATAVILTKNEKKSQYESIINSQKIIESNLFRTLAEQLTIEIVLRTVTDVNAAIDWICSTFMFIRIVKNPIYYKSNIPKNDFNSAQPYISTWCKQTLMQLQKLGLIKYVTSLIEPTSLARIFTRFSISLETTEKLINIVKSKFDLENLLSEICGCKEINQDIILRVNEKRFLNELNKQIRYKFKNRFKSNVMKINCLIQATFESLCVETCLIQDSNKILRSGQRVTKCLLEVVLYLFNLKQSEIALLLPQLNKLDFHFQTAISAVQLTKAFRASIWHDSIFVVKQLPKIGMIYANTLVERGYTSFDKILNANPREIEFCIKRNPPFGSYLIDEVKNLPVYALHLKQTSSETFEMENFHNIELISQIELKCLLNNQANVSNQILKPEAHFLNLIVGCEECDSIILMNRFSDKFLLDHSNIIIKPIIIILTKFNQEFAECSKNYVTTDNSSNEIKSKRENPKKNSKNSENVEEFVKIYSKEMIDFSNQFNQNNIMNNYAFHFSHIEDRMHTIKAMLISESFVGLDVEFKIEIRFDDTFQSNNSQVKYIETLKSNNQIENKETWSDGVDDDDDLLELLDDYNDKFFKNDNDNANNDSDCSLQDTPINSQLENDCHIYSPQASNDYHPIKHIEKFIEANDTLLKSCQTKNVQTNLFEKISKYRTQLKQSNSFNENNLSSTELIKKNGKRTIENNSQRWNFLTSIRRPIKRTIASKYFTK